MTTPTPTVTCPTCGAAASGRFCNQCGAPISSVRCATCSVDLTPGARFCHNCGSPARPGIAPRKERTAWGVAALLVVIAVAGVAYLIGRGETPAPRVPAMGNAGNAGAAGGGVRAPDISSLTPRQRFDRLFDRVLRAAENQSADTVQMFAPMALGAYSQLDQVDIDARYHAAMIHLVVGEFADAKAKADSILAESPKHLFGYLIRGEVAEQQNDAAALAAAYRDFLAAYDAEMKAGRREYLEHQPVLADFKNRASANAK